MLLIKHCLILMYRHTGSSTFVKMANIFLRLMVWQSGSMRLQMYFFLLNSKQDHHSAL